MRQDGIEMGPVGHFDVEFLRVAAIRWPELESAIRNPRPCQSGSYGDLKRGDYPHSPYTPPDE